MSEQSYPDFTFEVGPETDNAAIEQPKQTSRFNDPKLFSRLLRGIGAVIIIASASSFLFKHWTPGNDLERFFLLLGFTVILSLGGLFCGLRLKESKGARTLLGLTLAVTPVNFAVSGALLFSVFSWDGPFARLPGYATWIASSPGMAIISALAVIIILGPLCHLSFMTLGHRRASFFSAAFVLGNLSLLLPTRQPNLIAGVFALLVVLLSYFEFHQFRQETYLQTFEGRLSRGVLWLPALILVGRTSYFYTPTQPIISAMLIGLALLSFVVLPQMTEKPLWQHLLQAAGALLASLAWLNLVVMFASSYSFDDHWFILLCTLPLTALLYRLAKYSLGNGSNYRRAAALLALIGAIANLLILPSLLTGLLCLLISGAVLGYAYLLEQKIAFFSGIFGALLAVGYLLKSAFNAYSLLNWGSLMVLGVAIIIGASLLERNSGRLQEKALQIRAQLGNWGN